MKLTNVFQSLTNPMFNRYPPGHKIMQDNFDFFKYAGIHRSVFLYSTPRSYIEDISVSPSVVGTTGSLSYTINSVIVGTGTVAVALVDKQNQVVATGSAAVGNLQVTNAKLWWPYTMVANASDAGYLYTLRVSTIVLTT